MFVAPLTPPFGRMIVGTLQPLKLDSIPWAEPVSVAADGRKLICNGKKVARFASPLDAIRTADWITRLKNATELTARKRLIDAHFRSALDTGLVRQRLTACRKASYRLSVACHAEFAFLLVAFPLAAAWIGFRILLLPVVATVVIFGIFISREFGRAYRELHGKRDPDHGSTIATLLLSPISAIRAQEQLVRYSLTDFHPLAIASVLYSKEAFRDEAARYVREEWFPIPNESDSNAVNDASVEDLYRRQWHQALREFVESNGWMVEQFLEAPERESKASVSYCPRCCNQYTVGHGTCAECRLDLVRFRV
jgi:hypothetical protein